MDAVLEYWRALVRSDQSLPLFEAALSIAQDAYPDLPMAEMLAKVDAFALALRRRLDVLPRPAARIALLREYFANELGFRGNANDYYDPDNSYLNRVIERRLGIPISLSVLYIEISEQAGLPAVGLGFPGHFLVRHDLDEAPTVVDVFAGARSLSLEELEYRLLPYVDGNCDRAHRLLPAHLAAARPREVLARMLRNLQAVFVERGENARVMEVERRLAILAAPDRE